MTNKELDEMRKTIADSYYHFTVKQGWKLSGFERDIREESYKYADHVLSLQTQDCRMAVVRKKEELPRNPNLGIPVMFAEYATAQQDMLSAGFVQEVPNDQ